MFQHDDEYSSWRQDLWADGVHDFLRRVVEAAEVAELDLPHIVVCRDADAGAVNYSGPFPTAIEALVFAEREYAVDRELNDGDPLEFRVAALYPSEVPR